MDGFVAKSPQYQSEFTRGNEVICAIPCGVPTALTTGGLRLHSVIIVRSGAVAATAQRHALQLRPSVIAPPYLRFAGDFAAGLLAGLSSDFGAARASGAAFEATSSNADSRSDAFDSISGRMMNS